VIPRLIALALLAVVVLIAAGPLRPVYYRVEAWTWKEDERTWVAHGLLLMAMGFDAAVLGGWWSPALPILGGATLWVAGVYWGDELGKSKKPDVTTDNWMDALTPQLGAALGFALGLVLR
jgi:hypothetical protein